MPSGATTCGDVGHSVTFAPGDAIAVRISKAGLGTLTTTFNVQLGWAPAINAAAGLLAPTPAGANSSTGGIVVDNAMSGGGSQIYYATVRVPGIAVQASQAGLQ